MRDIAARSANSIARNQAMPVGDPIRRFYAADIALTPGQYHWIVTGVDWQGLPIVEQRIYTAPTSSTTVTKVVNNTSSTCSVLSVATSTNIYSGATIQNKDYSVLCPSRSQINIQTQTTVSLYSTSCVVKSLSQGYSATGSCSNYTIKTN